VRCFAVQVKYREYGVHALSMSDLMTKYGCKDKKFDKAHLYAAATKVSETKCLYDAV
jgi:hypothetical protein